MKIFLSHAFADQELAGRIAKGLKNRGFEVWDNSQLYPGDNWGEKIGAALREANAMVVLLTPNSLRSPNTQFELDYALGELAYKNRVVSVVAATSDEMSRESLPWVLRKLPMFQLRDSDAEEELEKIAQLLQQAA